MDMESLSQDGRMGREICEHASAKDQSPLTLSLKLLTFEAMDAASCTALTLHTVFPQAPSNVVQLFFVRLVVLPAAMQISEPGHHPTVALLVTVETASMQAQREVAQLFVVGNRIKHPLDDALTGCTTGVLASVYAFDTHAALCDKLLKAGGDKNGNGHQGHVCETNKKGIESKTSPLIDFGKLSGAGSERGQD